MDKNTFVGEKIALILLIGAENAASNIALCLIILAKYVRIVVVISSKDVTARVIIEHV